jgi:hypothetical protein
MSTGAALMGFVGPKAEAFVNDQRIFTGIMGPYGSAKTTSCIRKIVASALLQNPGPDGVRRVRWCVVRDTYAQLETNVLKSWFTWFEQTKSNWNGNRMEFAEEFDVILASGEPTRVGIEVIFRAMGDHKAEDVLKGLELTGLWLNETDTLSMDVFLFGWPRTGRYPSAKNGGCQWRGVIADFNAPDIDNWTYDFFVEKNFGLTEDQEAQLREALGPRFGIGFYRQPGGLSKEPPPENIHNLPEAYYEGLALGFANKPNHMRRFVHNEFGAVFNGQPVFPEFNPEIHVARQRIEADPNYPIHGGLDGGRTPALIFFQFIEGQMRLLDELIIYNPGKTDELQRLGPNAFAELAWDFVGERYPRCKMGTFFYDPAIDFGQDDPEEDWLRFFRKRFKGARFRPGGRDGNRLEPRLESVRGRLIKAPGGRPGLIVNPECRLTIRAFSAGYVIERVKLSNGSGRFRDTPTKNDFSHCMDGVQYGSLGVETSADILNDLIGRGREQARGRVKHGGYAGAGRK